MQLFSHIKKSEGLNQATITVLGNIFSATIAAISLIVISRTLGPTEFGVFSVGLSIATILSKINTAGFNTALIKYASAQTDKDKRNQLFSFVFQYKLKIFITLLFIGILAAPLLTSVLKIHSISIVIIAVLFFVVTVLYEHILLILQTLHLFNKAVILTFIQAAAKMVGIFLLLLVNAVGTAQSLLMYLVAPVVSFFFARKYLKNTTAFSLELSPPKKEKELLLRLVKYSAVGVIIAAFVENIDILFIQYYFTDYETGLLAGVSRIAMVISVISFSLANVLNPRVARYSSKEHLRKYIQKAAIVSFCFLFGFVFFVPIAPDLIYLTIGTEYSGALTTLLVLMLSSFLTLASVPFGALFFALKADWFFLFNAVVVLVVILLGNILFVRTGGLEAAALVRLMAGAISYILTIVLGLRQYHLEYGSHK